MNNCLKVQFLFVFLFLVSFLFAQNNSLSSPQLIELQQNIKSSIKLKNGEINSFEKEMKTLERLIKREKDEEKLSLLSNQKDELIVKISETNIEIESLLTQAEEIKDLIKSKNSEVIVDDGLESIKDKEIRVKRELKDKFNSKINEQKEQEERLKAEKAEELKSMKAEIKSLQQQIKQKTTELKVIDKELKSLVDIIIKSVLEDEVKVANEQKSDLQLQKTILLKEKNDFINKQEKLVAKTKIKDDGYEDAEGTLNWNKIYDIETIQRTKPGTWSISVLAKDSMDNMSEEKSINIKIDPKSDIPYLNIINPKASARVPGNLMVVGTAFDDDGVRNIVMYLNDENIERQCIGTDFWYYNLDTTDLEDGKHKLSFRVYDIKGVQSKIFEVPFVLDRRVPLISVDTINSGAVVSGRQKIGGSVSDSNGINKIEYSLDDRYSFTSVTNFTPVGAGRKKITWGFSLNTNLIPNGTQVVWIKATDAAGTEGFFPLTLIVDREKPLIGFNFPTPKERLGDRFTLYGYAYDNVEIKEVSIKIKANGFVDKVFPVNIIPGNPFWKFPVDISVLGDSSKLKSGACTITAIVKDVADNVVTEQLNLFLDIEMEKPVMTLDSIRTGDSFANNIPLYGKVRDDEEMKDVVINMYNSEKVSVYSKIVNSKYSFSHNIDVSNIPEGAYEIVTEPRDFHVTGNAVKEKIWIDRSPPEFDISKINSLWAGKIVNNKLTIDFSITKFGDIPVVTYELLDGRNLQVMDSGTVKLKAKPDSSVYDIQPIIIDGSKDKKYEGLKFVRLRAIDNAKKKTSVMIPVIFDTTSPEISDLIYDEKVGLLEDVTIQVKDNQIISSVEVTQNTSGKTEPNKINIVPGNSEKFVMKVKNDDGKIINYDYDIKVIDRAGLVTDKKIRIKFKDTDKEEISFTINVEKKDNSIYSQTARLFVSDTIINPDEQRFVYGQDPVDVSKIKVASNENSIGVQQISTENGFFMCDISSEVRKKFTIGENKVDFSNGDQDKVIFKTVRYYHDQFVPKNKVVWPPSYIPFNDNIVIYGIADDDSGIAAVYAGVDTTNDNNMVSLKLESISNINNYSVPILNPLLRQNNQKLTDYLQENSIGKYETGIMYGFPTKINDLKEGSHTITFKVVDKAGKSVYQNMVVIADKTKPNARIITPKLNESVNGVITVRGDASDDNGIGNVILSMNDRIIISEGTNIWDALYDVYERSEFDNASKDEKPIDVEVIVIDNAGNRKSIKQNVVINKNTDIPKIYINSPAVEKQRYTIDNIKFEGVALDDDGIDSVQYRLDYGLDELEGALGGASDRGWRSIILKKEELPNWSVTMMPGHLKPGKHTLEVRAYDYGFLESEIASITFQIDKENPVIDITGPENGSYIKGLRVVNGKASDPNDIEAIEVSTNNGWSFVPAEGQKNWQYYLDSSTLPDGPLNFLIKARDNAGSESYSFSVYNIDNTPPELSILQPRDGANINNKYRIVGRAKDNIALDKGYISITQGQKNMLTDVDEEGFVLLNGTDAWFYDIDTSNWTNGELYHVIVKMKDMAGNVTERSLDFNVDIRSDLPIITLDQPQSGQYLSGEMIEFYGTSSDDDGIEAVWIEIDGTGRQKAEGTEQWRYLLPSINLEKGMHRVVVVSQEKAQENGTPGKFSQSISRSFFVSDSGVVINIHSHNNGQPIDHRPWVLGNAYYHEQDLELKIKKEIQTKKYYDLLRKYKDEVEKVPPIDQILVKKHEVMSAKNKYLYENRVIAVYMSYDNGNTYTKQLGPLTGWQHRLQTQLLGDGIHMIQFKGVTATGKETIKYFKVKIDRNIPTVIIDSPEENKSLNESIIVKGSADDNNEILNVKIKLKRFDKNLGKLPKFIEGMYLWAQAFSGPVASGGFGFSFFDNIVRLEGLFGWIPTQENLKDMGIAVDDPVIFSKEWGWDNSRYEPRFSGFCAGGKLLAQVIDLPFEFFLGEDAKNFSISVEIGAGFFWISGFAGASSEADGTYYRAKREKEMLLTGQSSDKLEYDPVKDAKVLAGFMYQVDYFKVAKYGILKNFALYFEHSFYFIASEVESTLTQQVGFGLRNSLF